MNHLLYIAALLAPAAALAQTANDVPAWARWLESPTTLFEIAVGGVVACVIAVLLNRRGLPGSSLIPIAVLVSLCAGGAAIYEAFFRPDPTKAVFAAVDRLSDAIRRQDAPAVWTGASRYTKRIFTERSKSLAPCDPLLNHPEKLLLANLEAVPPGSARPSVEWFQGQDTALLRFPTNQPGPWELLFERQDNDWKLLIWDDRSFGLKGTVLPKDCVVKAAGPAAPARQP